MILRKLRLRRAWSQETLAELSGLSVRTIQRIERGQSAGLESLQALASVLELCSVLGYLDYAALGWTGPGWGVGLTLHGLVVFEKINLFGAAWERKQIEKRLGGAGLGDRRP